MVALESTLVAHGLPWPENLEIGHALEAEVRRHGALPATIAVVDGRIRVGIDGVTLERMARASGPERWRKAGVADLGILCARGENGATTVSATTFAAARAGIRVFATGGIGGVHRGDGADVSSDLTTLAREPVAVVSAGCKAILDLSRTLEMLETLAVPVLGVRTDEFPAFYTCSSGLPLEHRIENAEEAARICQAHWSLGNAGILVANPIPRSGCARRRADQSRRRRSARRRRSERHPRQGAHAAPAGVRLARDAEGQPRGESGAGAEQRRVRRRSWHGAGGAARRSRR